MDKLKQEDIRNTVFCGEALTVLKTFSDNCLDLVVTSPPYWGLRNYGMDGQLGLEPTPEEYVAKMVDVFREVRRVLREDGVLFLNLGDSYVANGSGQVPQTKSQKGSGHPGPNRNGNTGLKPKDLVGIPWCVAFALQADGWYLRSDIIWHKPNPMPESVTDRPTKAHEYVFLMTKSGRYFWDADAVAEPFADKRMGNPKGGGNYARECPWIGSEIQSGLAKGLWNENGAKLGKNIRSVWSISSKPFSDAHFATFPEKLVDRCVRAGTSEIGACSRCGAPWTRMVEKKRSFESGSGRSGNPIGSGKHGSHGECQGGGGTGDIRKGPCVATKTIGWQAVCGCNCDSSPCVVLDPFMGAGTVAVVSERLGRSWAGVELNPDYCAIAARRIDQETKQRRMFA